MVAGQNAAGSEICDRSCDHHPLVSGAESTLGLLPGTMPSCRLSILHDRLGRARSLASKRHNSPCCSSCGDSPGGLLECSRRRPFVPFIARQDSLSGRTVDVVTGAVCDIIRGAHHQREVIAPEERYQARCTATHRVIAPLAWLRQGKTHPETGGPLVPSSEFESATFWSAASMHAGPTSLQYSTGGGPSAVLRLRRTTAKRSGAAPLSG